jgi:lysophospholipid acyltransferase (LPLAT)-like uncharacterized protein
MSKSRLWVQRIGAPVILAILKVLWFTYRFRVSGDGELAKLAEDGRPVILTFWHGEIFVGGWFLRHLARLGFNLTFVVSPSKDGEFAMRLINRFGGQAVRGSATRSGVKALKGLYRAMTRDGGSPIVLPDGPRGPNRRSKEGAILLSQLAQAPIVPIAIEARPNLRLKTWDRLLVPPPFARVAVEVGPSFTVPKGLDEEAMKQQRQDVDTLLLELGKRARSSLGRSD